MLNINRDTKKVQNSYNNKTQSTKDTERRKKQHKRQQINATVYLLQLIYQSAHKYNGIKSFILVGKYKTYSFIYIYFHLNHRKDKESKLDTYTWLVVLDLMVLLDSFSLYRADEDSVDRYKREKNIHKCIYLPAN